MQIEKFHEDGLKTCGGTGERLQLSLLILTQMEGLKQVCSSLGCWDPGKAFSEAV
jgi:hypothetical protein